MHIVLLEFYLEGLWGEYYTACDLAVVKLKKLKKSCILWLLQDNRTFNYSCLSLLLSASTLLHFYQQYIVLGKIGHTA
jgi:hypothetical protein